MAFAHGLEGEQEGEGGEAELTVRLRKALDGLGAAGVLEVAGERRRQRRKGTTAIGSCRGPRLHQRTPGNEDEDDRADGQGRWPRGRRWPRG